MSGHRDQRGPLPASQPRVSGEPLVLDCRSPESALQCLSRHFGVGCAELQSFLEATDEASLCRTGEHLHKVLLRAAHAHFGTGVHPFNEVRWFHITAVLPHTDLHRSGLLPSSRVRALLIAQVAAAIENSGVERACSRTNALLAAGGISGSDYAQRVGFEQARQDLGPFGVLIRAAAFDERRNAKFLRTPEIVEDFFRDYEVKYGEEVLAKVREALTPTIVEFKRGWPHDRPNLSGSALLYLWGVFSGADEIHPEAVDVFDGEGEAVHSDLIERVEHHPSSDGT